MRSIRAERPRLLLALFDRELFVANLRSSSEMDEFAGLVGDVEVQVELLLTVQAGLELGRRVGSERGVDRVVDEEVDLAGAGAGAGVPSQPAGKLAADAAHRGVVDVEAAKVRREAARKQLLEAETIRVGEDLAQGRLVGNVIDNGHDRAAGRAVKDAVLSVQGVSDQQCPAAVAAEDGRARVGIAEEEAAGHPAAGIVRMAVGLGRFPDEFPEVGEELGIVALFWRTPDLGRTANRGVARSDQGRCVSALYAPISGIAVAVLEAEVCEAVLAYRHAHIGRVGDALSVRSAAWDIAALVGARPNFYAAAAGSVFEGEIEHAGDGVGTVLSRCAVAQDLDLLQGD